VVKTSGSVPRPAKLVAALQRDSVLKSSSLKRAILRAVFAAFESSW
jgi:hypothetical protein